MKEYNLTFYEYSNIIKSNKNGKYVVKDYGTFYYVNGLAHREDGPAYEMNSVSSSNSIEGIKKDKFWYFNGKYHRLDGPACEFHSDWLKTCIIQYYIHDKKFNSKQEFEIAVYLYKNQLESYQ